MPAGINYTTTTLGLAICQPADLLARRPRRLPAELAPRLRQRRRRSAVRHRLRPRDPRNPGRRRALAERQPHRAVLRQRPVPRLRPARVRRRSAPRQRPLRLPAGDHRAAGHERPRRPRRLDRAASRARSAPAISPTTSTCTAAASRSTRAACPSRNAAPTAASPSPPSSASRTAPRPAPRRPSPARRHAKPSMSVAIRPLTPGSSAARRRRATATRRALAAPRSDVHFAGTFAATATVYLTPSCRWSAASSRTGAAQQRGRSRTQPLRAPRSPSLAKRGNIEGAALFATLAARSTRDAIAPARSLASRAPTTTSTRSPSTPAPGRASQRSAVCTRRCSSRSTPGATHPDYYAAQPATVRTAASCRPRRALRDALAALPSFPVVAVRARRRPPRIVELPGPQPRRDRRRSRRARALGARRVRRRSPSFTGGRPPPPRAARSPCTPDRRRGTPRARRSTRARDSTRLLPVGRRACTRCSTASSTASRTPARARRSLLDYYGSPLPTPQAASRAWPPPRDAAVESLPDAHTHRMILTGDVQLLPLCPGVQDTRSASGRDSADRVFGPPLAFALALFRTQRLAPLLTGTRYV